MRERERERDSERKRERLLDEGTTVTSRDKPDRFWMEIPVLVTLIFGEEAATSFFSQVYHSVSHNYVQPEWMSAQIYTQYAVVQS